MPAISVQSGDALASTRAWTELYVNLYTPLMMMSGCCFLAPNRKSMNESRAWLTVVVAFVPTTGARLTGSTAAGANHDDGVQMISHRQR